MAAAVAAKEKLEKLEAEKEKHETALAKIDKEINRLLGGASVAKPRKKATRKKAARKKVVTKKATKRTAKKKTAKRKTKRKTTRKTSKKR